MWKTHFRGGSSGAASIAKRIGRAIDAADGQRIVAIGSRGETRGRELAAIVGPGSTVYPDYQQVLDDPRVDGVYIPLPNHLHCEWTIRAAEAGKHVLCEKPLALNRTEIQQQAEACRKSGVILSEAVFFHYSLRTKEIMRLINDGLIGDVRDISAVFSFHLGTGPNIRWEKAMGGGALYDIGSHVINLIVWLMGSSPTHIDASQEYRQGVDLSTGGLLGFQGGASASFWVSFGAAPTQSMVIIGEDGCLYVPRPISSWEVGEEPPGPLLGSTVKRGRELTEIALPGGDNPYVSMVQSFVKTVGSGGVAETGVSAAMATMAVMEACQVGAAK